MKPIFLLGCYGCIFHGTGNSAQLWQNFGISGGGVDPPPFGTPLLASISLRSAGTVLHRMTRAVQTSRFLSVTSVRYASAQIDRIANYACRLYANQPHTSEREVNKLAMNCHM
jgi:hypothetical protein